MAVPAFAIIIPRTLFVIVIIPNPGIYCKKFVTVHASRQAGTAGTNSNKYRFTRKDSTWYEN